MACCPPAGGGRRQPRRPGWQGNDAVAAERAVFHHRTGTGQPHRLGTGIGPLATSAMVDRLISTAPVCSAASTSTASNACKRWSTV